MCVSVALVIQHSKRVRRIILPAVTCLAVPCFSTSFHKRHDFRGGGDIEPKIRILICLQSLSETFLIPHVRNIKRDIIIFVHVFM